MEELKPVRLVLEKIFDSVQYSKSEVSQKHIFDEMKKKVLEDCKKCPERKSHSVSPNPSRLLQSQQIIKTERDKSPELVKHVFDDSFGSPSNKRERSSDMKPPLHMPHKSTDPAAGLRGSLDLLGKLILLSSKFQRVQAQISLTFASKNQKEVPRKSENFLEASCDRKTL